MNSTEQLTNVLSILYRNPQRMAIVGAIMDGLYPLLFLLVVVDVALGAMGSMGGMGGSECDDIIVPSPAGVDMYVWESSWVRYSCSYPETFSDGDDRKWLDCADPTDMSAAESLECRMYHFNYISSYLYSSHISKHSFG